MAEIKAAETAGTVQNKSEQQLNPPTPKNKSARASEKPETEPAPKQKRPKVNERGVPITNWDNDKNDPNKRKHVGEDPTGKGNKLS